MIEELREWDALLPSRGSELENAVQRLALSNVTYATTRYVPLYAFLEGNNYQKCYSRKTQFIATSRVAAKASATASSGGRSSHVPSCGCKVQNSMQATSLQSNSEFSYHHMKAATFCARQLLSMPLDENADPVQSNLVVRIPAWFGRVAVRNGANGKWRQVGVAQRHHRTLRRQSEAKAPSSTNTPVTTRR